MVRACEEKNTTLVDNVLSIGQLTCTCLYVQRVCNKVLLVLLLLLRGKEGDGN